jgi:hypothetical protein
MFFDSDDLIFPHTIERLINTIANSNYDYVSAQIVQELEDKNTQILPANNHIWTHAKIYRLDFLEENVIKFPQIPTNEDVSFNLIVSELAKQKKFLEEPLYFFRNNYDSTTHNKSRRWEMISLDYINAIYYAGLCVYGKTGKIGHQIIADVFECYNRYQIALEKNFVTNDIKQKLHFLTTIPEVLDFCSNEKKLVFAKNITFNFYVFDNEIIYFRQTFIDWLEEMQNYGNSNN